VIEGLDHIAIAVRSIAEARRFYEAVGLAVSHVEEVPQEGVRVAFIPVGDTHIELLEPLDEESTVARFLARRGPGLHHLCLRSGDVAGDDRWLRAAGCRLLREAPTAGAGGARVQFVHPESASGVLVELSQPAAGGERRE
jgi:methylmalonyl-CoA epimerase